jgi:hypothetical protein
MLGFMYAGREFLYLVFVMCGMADLLCAKGKGEATDSVVFYRCSTYFPFGLFKMRN